MQRYFQIHTYVESSKKSWKYIHVKNLLFSSFCWRYFQRFVFWLRYSFFCFTESLVKTSHYIFCHTEFFLIIFQIGSSLLSLSWQNLLSMSCVDFFKFMCLHLHIWEKFYDLSFEFLFRHFTNVLSSCSNTGVMCSSGVVPLSCLSMLLLFLYF